MMVRACDFFFLSKTVFSIPSHRFGDKDLTTQSTSVIKIKLRFQNLQDVLLAILPEFLAFNLGSTVHYAHIFETLIMT